MGDVGKRPAVDESRCVLGRLDQIRLQGIHQEHGDCRTHTHVPDVERLVLQRVAQEDVVDPPLQILQIPGQAEDGHDLRSRGDVESRFLRKTVGVRPQTGHDVPQ